MELKMRLFCNCHILLEDFLFLSLFSNIFGRCQRFWRDAEAGKQVGKSFRDRTEEVLPFQKTKINFCKSYQNTQNAASIQTILLNFKLATSNFTTGTLARRDCTQKGFWAKGFCIRRNFELWDFEPRDFVLEGILS